MLAIDCHSVSRNGWASNSDNSTNPDGTAFADPDDQPMPGMLQIAPDLKDYQGTANQLTPDQSGWIFSIPPQH
jgi:hypothetical protein